MAFWGSPAAWRSHDLLLYRGSVSTALTLLDEIGTVVKKTTLMVTRIVSVISAIAALILLVISFQASSQKKALTAELEQTSTELTSTKKELETTKTKLAETTKEKEEKIQALNHLNEELETTKQQLTSANEKLSATESELRVAKNEINTLKSQIEQITPTGSTGSVAEIAADLQKMRDETIRLQAENERLQEQLESANRLRTQLEKRIQALASGINPPGLEGKIIAVDSIWNFITFNLGQKDEIAQNSQVTVVRNGKPIAQVRVTSVENQRSYGDVIRLFGKDLPAVGDSVITN